MTFWSPVDRDAPNKKEALSTLNVDPNDISLNFYTVQNWADSVSRTDGLTICIWAVRNPPAHMAQFTTGPQNWKVAFPTRPAH